MPEKLRLYYPVKPYVVNQHFGENKPCVRNFGTAQQQVIDSNTDGTCPIGSDKLYSHFGMSGHNGMDLQAGEQNVYAACDGVVIEKQTVPARGLGLGILTNSPVDLGNAGIHYAKIRYWHLKSFNCEVGDKITAGQRIGVSDNTGYSSANHVHFELNPMDKDTGGHPQYTSVPTLMIAGAIDPEPYMAGSYAEDVPQIISWNQALITVLQKLVELLKSKKN